MYATLSYDINTGASPVDEVRRAIVQAFTGCDTCDLLPDTFIARVANTKDFLDRTQALKKVADDFTGQFVFVFTLHDSGAALRSNAPVTAKKINDIIKD
ncbi:MAG: hypothetical protein ABIS29_16180 [Vicinamibacterales bacterium]